MTKNCSCGSLLSTSRCLTATSAKELHSPLIQVKASLVVRQVTKIAGRAISTLARREVPEKKGLKTQAGGACRVACTGWDAPRFQHLEALHWLRSPGP